MNRREALKTLMLITGGTVFGAQAMLSGCARFTRRFSFRSSQRSLFNEFGNVIIPDSGDVAGFVETIVNDFYTDEELVMFKSGLDALASDGFSAERLQALETAKDEPYLMLKQLVVWSWLTSSQAAAEAYRYDPVPGDFPTDVPYVPGDKAIYPRFGAGSASRFARFHSS